MVVPIHLSAVAALLLAHAPLPAQQRHHASPPQDRDAPVSRDGPRIVGFPVFDLVDLSLSVLAAGGTSTERDAVLRDLQAGGHDPRKRGFTLQNVELSVLGAVDDWFELGAHLVWFVDPDGESVVEVEEAFAQTTGLPHGLELEVGYILTEFGRINPLHPHD